MPETQPIVLVNDRPAFREARRIVDEQRKKPGRPPNECVSIVFGGPPPYCHLDPDWPEDYANAYLRAGLIWWRKLLGPTSLIYYAVIHRDESAPHLHLLATPIIRGRVNWTDVLRKYLPRKNGARPYTILHTQFNKHVARGFGLERGIEGSEATHKEPDKKIAQACAKLRLRQIYADRQAAREAGQLPCGLAHLSNPEPWEKKLEKAMAESEEAERVKTWRKRARIPADQLRDQLLLARMRLIKHHLEVTEFVVNKLREDRHIEMVTQDMNPYRELEDRATRAWEEHRDALRAALPNGDLTVIKNAARDGPIPGFTAQAWDRRVKRYEEEQRRLIPNVEASPQSSTDAQIDQAEWRYELDLGTEPEAIATNDPSRETHPKQKPE